MSALAVGFADIEAAAQPLAGEVVRTPCLRSERLSELLGCDITLKFETFQHSSSFKDRGALVKLASLSDEERARGVIAMSAGNHAQGVALAAKALGIPATIFMPLGFIAGLYGMNFDTRASPFNMPELRWRFGYPFALALMLAVALGIAATARRLTAAALTKVVQARRRPAEVGVHGLVGTTGTARHGNQVFANGELWRARPVDGAEIAPGDEVEIVAVDDSLTLEVRPVGSD